MDKVYVVMQGEYSGRHIEAIFATREAAEQATEIIDRENHVTEDGYDAADIEEWPVLPTAQRTMVHTHLVRSWNPEHLSIPETVWGPGDDETVVEDDNYFGRMVKGVAPTAEQALKIAHDKVAEVNARIAGIT
jgi:hypothetical protein